MRHIFYLLIILILSTSTGLNAQVTISLSYDGNDVTNSEITLERDVAMHIPITNTGASDLDIVVEITGITTPHKAPSWEVCWGNCYPITVPIVLGTVTVPAGTTNDDGFYLTYNSDGNTEPANITFNIYEDGFPGDFVSLILDTEHVGINNIDQIQYMSIYPNPAISYFNIKVSDKYSGAEIVITNVIGKIIKSVNVERSENRFSVNEFSAGIYFISLMKNKEILSTKKLIVN